MFTYEPFRKYMDDHGISFYDLEQTPLSHGSVYNVKYDQTVSLPVINYMMRLVHTDDIRDIIKYYPDDTEEDPPYVLRSVSEAAEKYAAKEGKTDPAVKEKLEKKFTETEPAAKSKSSMIRETSVRREAVLENLNFFMRERQISVKQIAEALNRSEETVRNWTRGVSLPRADDLKALADLFQIDIREFLWSSKIPVFKSLKRGEDGQLCDRDGFMENPVLPEQGVEFIGYRLNGKEGSRFWPGDVLVIRQENWFDEKSGTYLIEEDGQALTCLYYPRETSFTLMIMSNHWKDLSDAHFKDFRDYDLRTNDRPDIHVIGRVVSAICKV